MNTDPSLSRAEVKITPERVVRVLKLCGLADESASPETVIAEHHIPSEAELRFLGGDVANVLDSIEDFTTADQELYLKDINLFNRQAS